MLTQPPIEGNLDCRARPFHSELCFDIAAFRLQPELAQTFNLLRRYHMEHLLTPRDFFYPGSHGFLSIHDNQQRSCKSITSVEGELPPIMFLIDAFLRHNLYPAALDSKKRSPLRSPVQDV
ncbi:hypothetical protein CK203_053752 [Vitis vinifera]|uniref:Uncharacterized protein n=1 Tax=Vitis vinifera TaxID=29760 RepID=A0A438GQS3_VITVI|nr:hypothetical protein CK203_053752 [Vitis vinifera]